MADFSDPFGIYVSKQGDTWEQISARKYGDRSYGNVIRLANLGKFEPLPANLLITIPPLPFARDIGSPTVAEEPFVYPDRVARVQANSPDEVTILVNGVTLRHFSNVEITRRIDSFSTLNFVVPFDPDNRTLRRIFIPLSFATVQVFVGGRPFFFGRLLPVAPKATENDITLEVSAYSLPGVLNDCTKSLRSDSQFTDVNIYDITRNLLQPFGVEFYESEFEDAGEPFKETSIKSNEKILKYLTRLAVQQNLIITDNHNGDMVYLRVIEGGTSVAHLQAGLSPMVSIDLQLKAQDWYSSVTGAKQVELSSATESFTVTNPFLDGVVRPYTFTVTDKAGSIEGAVKSKFARMVANVVTYKVTLSTWRAPSGLLWEPNTLIDVTAPNVMVYDRYTFLIKNCVFKKSESIQTCELELCLQGSYTGNLPRRLPWDS